jgi:uncharacterized protein YacL
MVSLNFVRIFFILICTFIGYSLGGDKAIFGGEGYLAYVLGGFIIGVSIVLFEVMARRVSLKGLSSSIFGIVLGLILGKLFQYFLVIFPLPRDLTNTFIAFVYIICIYFGLTLGLKGKEEFNLIIPYVRFRRKELKEDNIVVDTSSIIDGRILDIVKTGFLEARFVIPRSVLNELQALADSSDHLKRQKGKRGIEILHKLKKEPSIEVYIREEEIDSVVEVDEKIVKLAKILGSKILTTDYNLNRIAQLQGVKVLNINDLVNALKPILLPGEKFSLKLIKEGKEHKQAVGYLEDGTMVVVENARWLIGKTVNVVVTSVLQSPSGRMIFTKLAG